MTIIVYHHRLYLTAFQTTQAHCLTGESRLVYSNQSEALLQGRVEVCIGSAWGAICSSLFDERDATVVCHNLGFVNGGKLS